MSGSGGLQVGASVRTSPPRLAQAVSLAIAVAALAGAILTSRGIEARAVARAETPQPIFFPRAEILRPALLGFTGLAADLTWVRTVQYFGSRIEGKERFPQLYQLVDMTTSLDPHFLDAYQYGGLFLTIARQYPNAIAIYRKGIAANPLAWQLPHDLGRLYFLELQDYQSGLALVGDHGPPSRAPALYSPFSDPAPGQGRPCRHRPGALAANVRALRERSDPGDRAARDREALGGYETGATSKFSQMRTKPGQAATALSRFPLRIVIQSIREQDAMNARPPWRYWRWPNSSTRVGHCHPRPERTGEPGASLARPAGDPGRAGRHVGDRRGGRRVLRRHPRGGRASRSTRRAAGGARVWRGTSGGVRGHRGAVDCHHGRRLLASADLYRGVLAATTRRGNADRLPLRGRRAGRHGGRPPPAESCPQPDLRPRPVPGSPRPVQRVSPVPASRPEQPHRDRAGL